MLNELFRSVLEQDTAPVVICDLNHTILYENPAAKAAYGELEGKSLMDCHNTTSQKRISEIVRWFSLSEEHNRIFTTYNPAENKDVYMVALRDSGRRLIGYYEKHEYRTRESDRDQ